MFVLRQKQNNSEETAAQVFACYEHIDNQTIAEAGSLAEGDRRQHWTCELSCMRSAKPLRELHEQGCPQPYNVSNTLQVLGGAEQLGDEQSSGIFRLSFRAAKHHLCSGPLQADPRVHLTGSL